MEPLPLPPIEASQTLRIEQEFFLQQWRSSTHQMTEDDLRQATIILYRELMVRENYYQSLIKTNWGL